MSVSSANYIVSWWVGFRRSSSVWESPFYSWCRWRFCYLYRKWRWFYCGSARTNCLCANLFAEYWKWIARSGAYFLWWKRGNICNDLLMIWWLNISFRIAFLLIIWFVPGVCLYIVYGFIILFKRKFIRKYFVVLFSRFKLLYFLCVLIKYNNTPP